MMSNSAVEADAGHYAGQQQGGISTPAGAPYVFLFTGETGAQYGYSDGWGGGRWAICLHR